MALLQEHYIDAIVHHLLDDQLPVGRGNGSFGILRKAPIKQTNLSTQIIQVKPDGITSLTAVSLNYAPTGVFIIEPSLHGGLLRSIAYKPLPRIERN